jgi:hypothetical protein
MLKFTTLEGKVVPNPSVLLMDEFTDILSYGKKKKNEDLGNRMLIYIFYCCDLTEQNPLRDIDYRLKEENAFSRAFKKINKKKFTVEEKKLIDAAIDCYNFFNETALERATLTYDRKMDEIRTLLEATEPEIHPITDIDTGQIDKYVSNNKILADFSKQLNDMAIYKLKAMETAKKIENTGRVRGDKGSSLIERGAFRDDGK